MTAEQDFLAVDPIQRDRWKRPLLVPAAGGEKVAYTRASTLGGHLTDDTALGKWKLNILAKGLADRPDMCAMIAGLEPLDGTRKHDDPIKRKLSEIVELASEVGGAHEKANWGTAAHSFCEPGNTQPLPEKIKADVEAFRALNLDIVMSERFVANDLLMAAGSFDYVISLPGIGRVVGDLKSGMIKQQDLAVQLSVYAGGDLYDPETDLRTPLDVNQDVGLLVHLPHGQGKCDLYLVDLVEGRKAARVAAWVRDWRKRDDLITNFALPAGQAPFVPPWVTT